MIVVLNDFITWSQSGPAVRRFTWPTDVVKYDSGLSQRQVLTSFPIRKWELRWDLMPQVNRNELMELFHRARGQGNTFLYYDAEDYNYEAYFTADGATKTFQLFSEYYPATAEKWSENRKDIKATNNVKFSGAAQGAGWTVGSETGIITFAAAPPIYTIDAVNRPGGDDNIVITGDGDLSSNFAVGGKFIITGSTGNDGTYTINGIDWTNPDFTITIDGDLPAGDVSGSACVQITVDFDFYFRVAFDNDLLTDVMAHPDVYKFVDLVLIEVKI